MICRLLKLLLDHPMSISADLSRAEVQREATNDRHVQNHKQVVEEMGKLLPGRPTIIA